MTAELITKYFADRENGLQNLITLFEAITDQRDRAEANNRAHLHSIKKLSEAFSNITEPKTGKKLSDTTVLRTPTPTSPPTDLRTNKIKTKETLDLDL